MFSSTARYSRASSWTAGVGSGSSMRLGLHPQGVAGPGDPGPDDGAAGHPRMATAGRPPGRSPSSITSAITPTAGEAPLDVGHQQQAAAGRAGRLDRGPGLVGLERHGEDHPGQHHPGLEGSNGSVTFSFVIGVPFGFHISLTGQPYGGVGDSRAVHGPEGGLGPPATDARGRLGTGRPARGLGHALRRRRGLRSGR